ncbi:hypothetical protein [Aureispira anguillae]|uniref:DUF3244 domain-containing protein n=1 Tax=Aureispira anguillae TaxID=2864201 RepID=A0A915YLY2_9BACT|nr:hypothetical protein [Aureispira anguillae]BDS15548.1 hypothetical protein AsAng_0063320 [Aureispira anguillae]
MVQLFFITALSLLTLLLPAQKNNELVTMLEEIKPVYVETQKDKNQNLLNTIQIVLDKKNNQIHFKTPHVIEGVNITVKERGEKVVVKQNNMTINKSYSITFPAQAGVNKYTVILQKENHLLVERLDKDWM